MVNRGKTILALNIIKRRKALGFGSAKDFSEHIRVPYGTLRDIEAGYSEGRRETREAIAQGLGCSVEDLYLPENIPNSTSETVGSMSKEEFSKTLDDKLKSMTSLEITRLKKKMEPIPEDFFDLYPNLKPGRKALLLYVLTLDDRFVSFLSDETVKLIESVLRSVDQEKNLPP